MSSPLSEEQEFLLEQLYYDPASPGAYSSPWTLWKVAKQEKTGEELTLRKVKEWLTGQRTYSLFAYPGGGLRKQRPRFKSYAPGQAVFLDLFTVKNIFPSRFKYMLGMFCVALTFYLFRVVVVIDNFFSLC